MNRRVKAAKKGQDYKRLLQTKGDTFISQGKTSELKTKMLLKAAKTSAHSKNSNMDTDTPRAECLLCSGRL